MPLKLMYLTNNSDIAKIAEKSGVDRIFIDLELRGKVERQGHLDTVISYHSIDDIKKVKEVLNSSELLVRVNSIYDGSKTEIDSVIKNGADIVMLPYFKTVGEVEKFVEYVDGRAKTCLLCETPECVEIIDEILKVQGIDEAHIGLNDLHLGYGLNFMFELVANGTVEKLCNKFKEKGIKYGFGGVAKIGEGMLPGENVIKEHYRLGSSRVILSRAFCDSSKITDLNEIEKLFSEGVENLRMVENEVKNMTAQEFSANHVEVQQKVQMIVKKIVG